MQSYLQYRRIAQQLQRQTDPHKPPAAGDRTTLDSQGQEKQEEQGQTQENDGSEVQSSATSVISGHPCGLEMEQVGDVERADLRLEARGNPYTIHTREAMGNNGDVMVSGLEKEASTDGEVKDKIVIVAWEGDDDPMDPHNWTFRRRLMSTILVSLLGALVGFASGVDAGVIQRMIDAFDDSFVAESLTTTGIFLIGFGFGSLLTGPFSEVVGRNSVYITTLAAFTLFTMGSGLASDTGSFIVCRFFAGFFGSSPLVCAGGSLADVWSPIDRVWAFPVFASISFAGTIFGPVPGTFIGQSMDISWRWVAWVTVIFSGLIFSLVVLFQPETYGPILLKWKATHLRRLTGDARYYAPIEMNKTTLMTRLGHALYRPFLLAIREPIIALVALYLALLFIILYTFLAGYRFIFFDTYHFSHATVGVCFQAITVGVILSWLVVPIAVRLAKWDVARAAQQGRDHPEPETSLYMAMFGAPTIPLALFWMAWTTRPSIPAWSPLAASVLFGFGTICVFISTFKYVVDSYELYAASAVSSITVIRYVSAGAMTEVSLPFYEHLGVAYTLTVMASLSALLVPVPFVFYRYGQAIRGRSQYAVR